MTLIQLDHWERWTIWQPRTPPFDLNSKTSSR